MVTESSKNRRPLPISMEDGAFSRLLSRESNAMNSSSRRVYYGGSPASVPFLWESRPGTPKHAFSDSSMPPLTPPPSYRTATSIQNRSPANSCDSKANLLRALFPRLSRTRRSSAPRGSVLRLPSSSSSSSCSSSSVSSPSLFGGGSEKSSRSSRTRRFYDGDGGGCASSGRRSPISTLCFGGGGGGGGFRGRCYVANVKRALFSAVGHGSG